jgi:alpha-1,6-mannosyltransferase
MCALSFGLSVFFPIVGRQSGTIAFLTSIVAAIPWLGASAKQALIDFGSGNSFLADANLRSIAYNIPVTVSTAIAVGLAVRLARTRATLDRSMTRRLTIAAVVVGVIHALSLPVFTRDMWLSVSWGRMALQGVNPYYVPMLESAREGLPFSDRVVNGVVLHTGRTMTYGPLWGVISAGMAAVAPNSPLGAFLISKAVLFAAWVATLFGLVAIARRRSERDAAIAATLFGFLPVSRLYTLAEGHNDIVMVAPMVLWFGLATSQHRARFAAPLALVAAALVKYTCAPLAVLDMLATATVRRADWRKHAMEWMVAIVCAVLVIAPFYRDPTMFAETAAMRSWGFLSPAAAISDALGGLIRVGSFAPRGIQALVALLAAVPALIALVRFRRRASAEALCVAALVVLWAVTFAIVGHVWPWFVLWPLPFAILLWHRPIGRAYLLLAVLSPIMNVAWFRADAKDLWTRGAGFLYFGIAVGCLALLELVEWVRRRETPALAPAPTPRPRPGGVLTSR